MSADPRAPVASLKSRSADILVVGAGPAGMAAAVTGADLGLRVLRSTSCPPRAGSTLAQEPRVQGLSRPADSCPYLLFLDGRTAGSRPAAPAAIRRRRLASGHSPLVSSERSIRRNLHTRRDRACVCQHCGPGDRRTGAVHPVPRLDAARRDDRGRGSVAGQTLRAEAEAACRWPARDRCCCLWPPGCRGGSRDDEHTWLGVLELAHFSFMVARSYLGQRRPRQQQRSRAGQQPRRSLSP